jgi:hypothetical protein
MLRRTVIASIAGSLVLLAPSIASADPITSRAGLPSGFSFVPTATPCTTSPTGSYTHQTGPGTPVGGTGSLRLSADAASSVYLTYDLTGVPPANLTSYSVQSYLPSSGAPVDSDVVIFMTDTLSTTTTYQGVLALPVTTDSWQHSDVVDSSSTQWVTYVSGIPQGSPTTESYASFILGHPTAALSGIAIIAWACPQSGTPVAGHFNVDDISVTINSVTTVYDFEAPIPTALSGRVSKHAVAYGGAVTPSATLTTDGSALADHTLTLWQRPAGARTFTKVTDRTTNASGVATGPVEHPHVTTAYRWSFAADDTYAGASSPTMTVSVASKLSLNLDRSKVKKGKTFHATGIMTPKHGGDAITLYATRNGHTAKVAAGKVRRDGSYDVAGSLSKKGTYEVFTTAAADATNIKGTSGRRKLVVD